MAKYYLQMVTYDKHLGLNGTELQNVLKNNDKVRKLNSLMIAHIVYKSHSKS